MNVPSWLGEQVPLPPKSKKDIRAFARRTFAALKALGLSDWQACELTAMAALETAWGTSEPYQLHNAGGVKPRKARAAAYLALTGKLQRWCRKAGHVKQADAPVVQYLVYDSDEQFWRLWLAEFVGAGVYVQPYRAEYRGAGTHAFWRNDPSWLAALIEGGYRGPVTRASPAKALAQHRSIVARVKSLVS